MHMRLSCPDDDLCLARAKQGERPTLARIDRGERPQYENRAHVGKDGGSQRVEACANVRRLCAVAGLPSMEISGLVTT